MKTVKLVTGIISMISFLAINLQSCAIGISNALGLHMILDDTDLGMLGISEYILEDTYFGMNSIMFSFMLTAVISTMLLIAGIAGVATRKSKSGGITTGSIYIICAAICFAYAGNFGFLTIWSVLALAFGVIFIICSVPMKKALNA